MVSLKGFLKKPMDYLKSPVILLALLLALGLYFGMRYSSRKGMSLDTMSGNNVLSSGGSSQVQGGDANGAATSPANPEGHNGGFAAVSGMDSNSQGLPPSANAGKVNNADDLLPKDQNSEWARLNPSGSHDFGNVNLLKAGYHAGIDTVAGSMRNANLQVRSEPPNPTLKVSPWMNSTIEPDLMRLPLEIGSRTQ
jgi:hypothetical protein|uniref:Minor capsid protein P11 C-terminal conserved region domain-containing protein n=1 Tax=viral metagenome TaxID=1070528 RepID=A0A6C0JDL0_9ZZZZ